MVKLVSRIPARCKRLDMNSDLFGSEGLQNEVCVAQVETLEALNPPASIVIGVAWLARVVSCNATSSTGRLALNSPWALASSRELLRMELVLQRRSAAGPRGPPESASRCPGAVGKSNSKACPMLPGGFRR